MFGSNFRFGGMPQRPAAPGGFFGGAPSGGAGRSAGMFGGAPPRQGGFGQMAGGAQQMAGQAAPQRPGFGGFGARPQVATQRVAGGPGGFSAVGGMSQMGRAVPQRPPGMAGQMSGMMGAAGGMLSDEESKMKIQELEDELSKTYAALGGKSATGDVSSDIQRRQIQQQAAVTRDQGAIAPREAQLLRERMGDDEDPYRGVGSYSYDYKDPSIPGASPGRHVGPMAHELRPLGVTEMGPDGLERVNGPKMELANASEVAKLRREMDALMGNISSGNSNPDGTF